MEKVTKFLEKGYQLDTKLWCRYKNHIADCGLILNDIKEQIVEYSCLCFECYRENNKLQRLGISIENPVYKGSMSVKKWAWLEFHKGYLD